MSFAGSTINVVSDDVSKSYDVDDIENFSTQYFDMPTSVDSPDAPDFIFRNIAPDRYEVSGSAVREVRLYNLGGILLEQMQPAGGAPVEVDLSDRQTGVYLVNVNLGARTETVKIIKK